MKTVLIIDDDKSIRDSLKMILEYERYEVELAEYGEQGLQQIETVRPDAVILDIKMAGMDGIEVLTKIRSRHDELPVIMISGHGNIETAVEATKLGAFDFLSKPLDRDKLLVTIRNALQQAILSEENRTLREHVDGKRQILGSSPAIKKVLDIIERIAKTDTRILITGENGTGKELAARAIHRQSRRCGKPFVEVNCAAIPAELIESELFGHEKGSFTGATAQRIGKFEQADGGTLFLDEIGDMSLQVQAKVLRALEESTIERVGSNKLLNVDVRVLAATNKNLEAEIEKGNFRKDLFHRINVIPLHMPPLRDHCSDVPILTAAFVEDVCARNGMAKKIISAKTLDALMQNDWPGNVRELRNTVERLIILSPGNVVDIDALALKRNETLKTDETNFLNFKGTFQDFKDYVEAAFIKYQLEKNNWNVTKTAELLDIQRSHLYTKMKQYGLEKEPEG